MTTGKAWKDHEINLITSAYAAMLRKELDGVKFNKSAIRRLVTPTLDGRSEGSYELKMMNISAACKDAGLPFINGYKPMPAYQAALKPAIIRHCAKLGIHQPRYEGVNRLELVQRLGHQCSPDPRREGYVIGPANDGMIRHCATCFSLGEAQIRAREANAKYEGHNL